MNLLVGWGTDWNSSGHLTQPQNLRPYTTEVEGLLEDAKGWGLVHPIHATDYIEIIFLLVVCDWASNLIIDAFFYLTTNG